MFQSIAGTEAANASFGVDLALLREAHDAALVAATAAPLGDNVMYFETGQGSALSANAHHGVDQQTCEARAYAVARAFEPLLVNTVVGFIGPEYLYDGKQIIRAGLEDHFCGKLLGAADGLRRLLHQPRRGRPGRHGHAADAAGRGRRATSSWACPARTTSCSTTRPPPSTTRSTSAGARPAAGAGVRSLAERMGLLDDERRVRALAPRSPELARLVDALEAS